MPKYIVHTHATYIDPRTGKTMKGCDTPSYVGGDPGRFCGKSKGRTIDPPEFVTTVRHPEISPNVKRLMEDIDARKES